MVKPITTRPSTTKASSSKPRPIASTSKLAQQPSRRVSSTTTTTTTASKKKGKPGAAGKGKSASKGAGLSEKSRGKRRRVEDDDEDAGEQEEDASAEGEGRSAGAKRTKQTGSSLIRSAERVVPRATMGKSWRKLSRAGQAELRSTLEEGSLELLAQLDGKKRGEVQVVLRELYESIDDYFADLVVPPTHAALRGSQQGATRTAVDLLTGDSIVDKIAALEAALDPELAEVRSLERAIKREQKLLEEDEARLESFEGARLRVEAAEVKESSKNMNPLLAELLASRKAPTTASDLFNRKSASSLWIKESVESALPPVKVPRLDDDEIDSDDDQEEGAYDPAHDEYLSSLSERLEGSLAAMEARLVGLRRVQEVVNRGEEAVAGMF